MRILTAMLFVLALHGAQADILQWRDASGNIHFGDRAPADVESRRVEVRANVYHGAESAPASIGKQVVLYSTQRCGFCRQARSYFQKNRIAYTEYDVERSTKGRLDYARLGARGVPVILVGEERLDGFSVAGFERIYASQ